MREAGAVGEQLGKNQICQVLKSSCCCCCGAVNKIKITLNLAFKWRQEQRQRRVECFLLLTAALARSYKKAFGRGQPCSTHSPQPWIVRVYVCVC